MSDREREREADGRYAPDEQPTKVVRKGTSKGTKGFQKGHPRYGGRKKGTPNGATREWKQFCMDMVRSGAYQAALEARLLDRPELGFRVAEFAVGKPAESMDVNVRLSGEIVSRLLEARKRLSGKS